MFNGLVSERDYWGHQHYLVEDGHAEAKCLSLKDADSQNSSVSRANFSKAYFHNVDLSGACIYATDFSHTILENCKLNDTEFRDCIFTQASFVECEMENTSFPDSNLTEAKMHSDISRVSFNYAYGENRNFISRRLYDSYGGFITFGATAHKVYIGCKSWDTVFFGKYHRQIIGSNYCYYSLYKKYRSEILNVLAEKVWIERPSLLTSLANLIPVRDRRV